MLFLQAPSKMGRKEASAWGAVARMIRQRLQSAQARCRHAAAARWEPCAEIGARDFERQDHAALFDAQRPLIVREFACKWPAVSRWADLDALAARAAAHQDQDAALGRTAPLLVPVEVGHSYADGGVEKVQADFQELLRFVKRYWLAPPPSGTPNVYLAQTRLADVLPALAEDLGEPALVHECGRGDDYGCNLWLGHAGTRSDCHWDPYHNWMVAIVGTKQVVLFSPQQAPLLYARSGLERNTSAVDVGAPDEARFPRFREARGCHATLADGDALFIPKKWWHYCENAPSGCIAVNFWWL